MGSTDCIDAQSYYISTGSPEIAGNFFSLDDASKLDWAVSLVESRYTKNFMVDFSDDAAWSGFDISSDSVALLCETKRPRVLQTRWINIWNPSQQTALLESLGKRFDFSPRLLALMCSNARQLSGISADHGVRSVSGWQNFRNRFRNLPHRLTSYGDLEKMSPLNDRFKDPSVSISDSTSSDNIYKPLDRVRRYSSVDIGPSYVCLGYSSLYDTKQSASSSSTILPQYVTIWTWLLLCEDHTVISINEDPFSSATGEYYDAIQQRVGLEVRRTVVDIFHALSNIDNGPLARGNPLRFLAIRSNTSSTGESAHPISDAAGLLFYYLFENWNNNYSIIAQQESQYGRELAKLREEMMAWPQLQHIDRLDRVGRDLNVLRRHFESQMRIIDRVIEIQITNAAGQLDSSIFDDTRCASPVAAQPVIMEKESVFRVLVPPAARMRFQRLRDLIDLYALGEMDEYIKQKDALVGINFSLIAIKQSGDVERLTRITLLLTKLTILFLPMSLMTAYFSVQLEDVTYSVEAYWTSFAVVFALSSFALLLLGRLAGNVQAGKLVKGLLSK